MSRPHSPHRSPRPGYSPGPDVSMSGALPERPLPQSSGVEQMMGPAAYDTPQQRPAPSPYIGTDPFRPQRTSELPQQEMSMPGPPLTPMLASPEPDLRTARSTSHEALGQLVELVRRRQGAPPASTFGADIDSKIRAQAAIVLGDLRMLRGELRVDAKGREGNRWRRWIVGGAV